jgi:hypothetical protein
VGNSFIFLKYLKGLRREPEALALNCFSVAPTFRISQNLTAGTTYYLKIQDNDAEEYGNYSFRIMAGN